MLPLGAWLKNSYKKQINKIKNNLENKSPKVDILICFYMVITKFKKKYIAPTIPKIQKQLKVRGKSA